MKHRLRYDLPTRHCRDRFHRALKKIGKVLYVKGYRYFGRYHTSHEAVLVRGEKGTIRFGGLLWGYSGEGPRGTHELLTLLGVPAQQAWEVAFQTPRLNQLGEDWRLTLGWTLTPAKVKVSVPQGV